MNNTELKSKIESLLFIAGKPLRYQKFKGVIDIKIEQLKDLLEEMNKEYEEGGRGVRVLIKSDSAQLVSAPANAGFVQKLVMQELQGDISKAAIETLSIIAYRGPITRAEIEMIRGVNCIYILRNLLLRSLISKRDSKEDARVSVYEVSFDLLKHLGVSNVKDLPNYDKLHEKMEIGGGETSGEGQEVEEKVDNKELEGEGSSEKED